MLRFGSKLALITLVALSFSAYAEAAKKIVFVAGPKDHGRPGRHEYIKDLEALKYCLENASNLEDVTTQMFTGRVIDYLDEAGDGAVFVLESSGDRIGREVHAMFPTNVNTDGKVYDPKTTEQLKQVDELMKAGAGLVILHYATWVDNETGRAYFNDWVGGYHEGGYSKVLVSDWDLRPTDTDHPVLNGVEPFSLGDEMYINEHLPWDERRTPLIMAKLTNGGVQEYPISWAVQREGGGRGFVMSGVDYHKNMWDDQQRRLLANGIAWAAGLDVPAGGVSCELAGPIPADAAAISTRR